MNDEAMKMARRIVNEVWEAFGALSTKERAEKAALAAIIETRERCAAVAEADADRNYAVFEAGIGGDAGKDRNAARYRTALRIAAAIRSGQQFRKDGSGGGEYIRCTWIETTVPVDPWPNIKPPKGNIHD